MTAPNTTSGINLALAPGASLAGTITNASTSAGVSGVTVSVYNSAGNVDSILDHERGGG